MTDKLKPKISASEQQVLEEVLRAMRLVRHGSVQVVVQDGLVVQIDTLEKKRFDRGPLAPAAGRSSRSGESG